MQHPIDYHAFITAFLVVHKPAHTFQLSNDMRDLDDALFAAATPLLERFEAICRAWHISMRPAFTGHSGFDGIDYELTSDFIQLLVVYFNCFAAWRARETVLFIDKIQNTLNALYRAKENIHPNEPHTAALTSEFATEINRLRAKYAL